MNSLTRYLLLFSLLLMTDFTLGAIVYHFFLPEQLVLESLSKKFTQSEIATLLKHKEDHYVLLNLLKGIFKLFNIVVITSILSIGILLNDFKVQWIRIINIVTIAQFVFFIPLLLKLGWFSFIKTDYTYANFSDFSALSLYNLLDYAEEWQRWPLKQLNIFEFLFWLILAIGLQKAYNIPLSNGMSIVVQSYGVSFFLWITVIVFLSIM
ncbi:hypothetical protein GGR92_004510 [Spirosoma lacussanchae]